MIMSGIHIHTLQKQLCLNYNSLGVLIHLAERRVHDDIIYASYDCIFHAIYAGAAEQICCVWVQAVKKATPSFIPSGSSPVQ